MQGSIKSSCTVSWELYCVNTSESTTECHYGCPFLKHYTINYQVCHHFNCLSLRQEVTKLNTMHQPPPPRFDAAAVRSKHGVLLHPLEDKTYWWPDAKSFFSPEETLIQCYHLSTSKLMVDLNLWKLVPVLELLTASHNILSRGVVAIKSSIYYYQMYFSWLLSCSPLCRKWIMMLLAGNCTQNSLCQHQTTHFYFNTSEKRTFAVNRKLDDMLM